MISLFLAILDVCCGGVYVTPGVLPVAALSSVKWSRHVVGLGMLTVGGGELGAWWSEAMVLPLLQLGLGLVGGGLAATLVTILRQPCPPKA